MQAGRDCLMARGLPFIEREVGDMYLLGNFTLADAPFMAVAMVLEVDGMDLSAFPKTAAYLDRLRRRPSYRAISPKTSLEASAGRG